jgi:oligopeptide/dipeptide ABC transporter ATP-binding protein
MGMIFITHDLGVIAQIADEVAVMYLGTIVERGPTAEVIRTPLHPYTRGLLERDPQPRPADARLTPVPGDIPSPASGLRAARSTPAAPRRLPACAMSAPARGGAGAGPGGALLAA